MRVQNRPPVYEVGLKTWQTETRWYASTIAHDAYHSLLYHEYKSGNEEEPPDSVWTGEEAEKKCLEFQRTVLKELCSNERCDHLENYLETHLTNPTYQDIDYQKRNW